MCREADHGRCDKYVFFVALGGILFYNRILILLFFFFFQAEDGIRDYKVTGVQTCALPISFNISTAAAFVAAAAGVRVAKHGNRSATSRCGSADVMEALGLDIQMPVERLRRAIKSTRIGFLFAQRFHTSMKHVMAARMQLKVRTVFNILGPLANPAGARFQVVGVSAPEIMELMANALNGLNTDHAFVVHGANGMDEVSISSRT